MTGELIHFERHRDLKRGQLYDQQPVPRGPTPAVRSPSIVELRVARIARLLIELEELTRLPRNVPPTTLDQARAGLEKARRIVRPWTAVDRQQQEDDLDGDPQPELDDERIERMYRELNQDA
jgi:hypothetical protein